MDRGASAPFDRNYCLVQPTPSDMTSSYTPFFLLADNIARLYHF